MTHFDERAREALAWLDYGLARGEGVVLISGEPGSGKTALAEHLRARVDPERANLISLYAREGDTAISAALLEQLAPVAENPERATLLIVDDAHALSDGMLAHLLALTDAEPAAQLFLFGRPGLRARIDGHEALAEWRGKVIAAHHLGGLPEPAAELDPIARLEARVAEQEEALRRLLTVMVDWVENGRPARAA